MTGAPDQPKVRVQVPTPSVDPTAFRATQSAEHARCVVCGAANPAGLKLQFALVPDGGVAAVFQGDATFEGYPGLVHGGIVCALVDGAMTNCLFSRGITAVTAELSVRYVEGVRSDRPAEIRGWCLRKRGPIHAMQAEIRQDGRVVVRASAKFMAKRRLHGTAPDGAADGKG